MVNFSKKKKVRDLNPGLLKKKKYSDKNISQMNIIFA